MSRVSVPSPAVDMSHDIAFVAHDARFGAIVGDAARLVHVAAVDAHEGPVAVDDALYFTSMPLRATSTARPLVAIRRLTVDGPNTGEVTTVVDDANAANGMTLDLDGRSLLVCEQGSTASDARITRLDPVSGGTDVVADAWEGLPLNSPNDVAVHPADGSIWFTDPSYGRLQGFRPAPEVGDHVYRIDGATGAVTVADDSMDKPNGLAFSPDGSTLYVTDSGANQEPGSFDPSRPHEVIAFDVRDGRLVERRSLTVIAPGFPDGVKTDEHGNLYVSSFSGVLVFSANGDRLGDIHLPGAVNFDFGGGDGDTLFITTDDAVWAARLSVRGARWSAARPAWSAPSPTTAQPAALSEHAYDQARATAHVPPEATAHAPEATTRATERTTEGA